MPHELRRRQWVPHSPEQLFAFFSDARNLQEITPDWLGFEILTPGPIRMDAGARIDYRLHWHGIPMRWTTEIALWDPPYSFQDIQLKGPYRTWRHTHTFEPENGGTAMSDRVQYDLPFGFLGVLAHALTVRRNVERIFDYRYDRIRARFGGPPRSAA